jgi:hypothetical protein
MSTKLCKEPTCGKQVVFAKDIDTDKWQVLSNQAVIYKIIGVKKGITYVQRDTKALLSHFQNCTRPDKFSQHDKQLELTPPEADRHFSEPKES